MHFAKTFNQNDFVDVVLNFTDKNNFKMFGSVYSKNINPLLPVYDDQHLPIYSVNIDHGYFNLFRGAIRLSRLLRKNEIDILHTHHFYESVIGTMACMLYPKCKLVIGRHYHNEFYLTAAGLKLKYYLFIESLANRFAKRIVSPSTLINKLLIEQGVSENKIVYIPYGFNFNSAKYNKLPEPEIEVIKKQMQCEGFYLLGNFSRHHIIKGQNYLLKAFKRLLTHAKDVKLIMVGDGPYGNELKKMVKEDKIEDHVIFLGYRIDVSKLMNIMDVIVHPTLQEAFPQVMIEAMALEKPLIISSVSGVTDVVIDGQNGISIPSEDEEALLNAMKKCWIERQWAKQLGRNAGIYVREHLTVDKIIKRYEQMYYSVYNNKY